jgi:hypothetical protein
MRNLLLASVTAACLAVVSLASLPVAAGEVSSNGCYDRYGKPAQRNCAFNNLNFASGANQHIDQDQFLITFFDFFKVQKQTAKNTKYKSNGGTQSITQKQNGIILLPFFGPAQKQTAKNSSKKGDNNNQTINQTQNALILFSKGTAQSQTANNSVYHGSDNNQTTSQTQNVVALGTHGTVQSQTANNVVVHGSGNTQTINQSQTLIVLGMPGGGGGCGEYSKCDGPD